MAVSRSKATRVGCCCQSAIGTPRHDLGQSLWLREVHGREDGPHRPRGGREEVDAQFLPDNRQLGFFNRVHFPFGAAVLGLALAWAYSMPPLRLKLKSWPVA